MPWPEFWKMARIQTGKRVGRTFPEIKWICYFTAVLRDCIYRKSKFNSAWINEFLWSLW